jgi:hypothetical protein
MSKMKREPCPVCGQSVAVNWHSRVMDYHRRRFSGEQKLLIDALSKFNLDSLGPKKYGKTVTPTPSSPTRVGVASRQIAILAAQSDFAVSYAEFQH